MSLFKIAVTGSIGSGKTTVSRLLSECAKIPIIDADQIARKVVEPGQPALDKIIQTFGNDILSNGILDRKKLGDIIFPNPLQRSKLNSIMFPIISSEVSKKMISYEKNGAEYVIYDVPFLFESGYNKFIDYVVAVYISQEMQFRRLQRRNDLTDEETEVRIAAQPPSDAILKYPFDFLIRNTMNFSSLKNFIISLWEDIQLKKGDNNASI